MKTKSLWGSPPTRYYSLLRLLDMQLPHSARNIAVLGCADGKYVLPAARRGYRVYAVDVDSVALFGGTRVDASGAVRVPGLVKRLELEKLSGAVTVRCSDFTIKPEPVFPVVFTSGSLQYALNRPKGAEEMVSAVLAYAAPGGYVCMDYMLPWEEKYRNRPNCPDHDWWRTFVQALDSWTVLRHRKGPPVLDKAHIEFPTDHFHQWGHILLKRCV